MRENHTQYPQKVNVLGGIFKGRPVGTFFIEGNLTAQMYEAMLREQIIPAIQEIAGRNLNDIYFLLEIENRIELLFIINVHQYLMRSFLIG